MYYNDLDNLGKSVSDGKSSIASAITAQGVTTAADATFSVMASNITTAGNNRYNTGYSNGNTDGYNSGYSAGKNACDWTLVLSVSTTAYLYHGDTSRLFGQGSSSAQITVICRNGKVSVTKSGGGSYTDVRGTSDWISIRGLDFSVSVISFTIDS